MISFRQFICIWIFIITLLTFPLFAQEKLPAKLHENLRVVLHNTQPLKYPRGNRLSLYVWPITDRLRGLDDGQAEQAIKLLNDRGIAMISNWRYDQKEKTLTEALRIGALQKKLHLRVNVNATSCMYAFFNGDERTFHIDEKGKTFFDDSFSSRRKMGCPFALKFRYPVIKERLEYFLRAYKKVGLNIDFIFVDWEIDGPIEWNDAWEHSRRCRRCRENIPHINDFRAFQKALRLVRCDIQKVVYAETVKAYFPRVLVGNYGVYPHNGYRYWYDYFETFVEGAPYQPDQKAKYREWFPEFDLTGYTFAMPVVYTRYPTYNWYDFDNSDYRWFYNLLLVASNAARHTAKDVPIISFVHWTTTSPPKNPDPGVKQFSEKMYRELIWHMLLRGIDGLFLWCPQREFAREVRPLHQVYAAALQYKDFLDHGKPIRFDVPSQPQAVISGLKWKNQVLLRRTDFTDSTAPVKYRLQNQTLTIPRLEGKIQVIELRQGSSK